MESCISPYQGRQRLFRIALVVCALLVATGLACGHGPNGVLFVGAESDGTLIAQGLIGQSGEWDLYVSDNGGLSWRLSATYQGLAHPRWQEERVEEVDTPRGRYRIINNGMEIVRSVDGKSETAYSLKNLLDRANITLRINARASDGSELHSIYYDAVSGNVIAAMETEGVIVEKPGGQWLRVGVGRFTPTYFSPGDRTRLLLSEPGIWLSILAVLASFTSVVFVLVVCRWLDAILATAIVALTYAFYVYADSVAGANGVGYGAETIVVIVAWPVVMVAMFIALQIWDNESVGRKSLALAAAGFVLAGAVFGFPGLAGYGSLLLLVWVFPALYGLMLALALSVAAVAAWPYRPMGRDWRKTAIAAMLVMLLALLGPVTLWLQYVLTLREAIVIAIGMTGATAFALYGYLERRQVQRRKSGFWY